MYYLEEKERQRKRIIIKFESSIKKGLCKEYICVKEKEKKKNYSFNSVLLFCASFAPICQIIECMNIKI